MKLQDIAFIIILLIFLSRRDTRIVLILGILCLLMAIPLYIQQIFFTAQRLVLYGYVCVVISVIGMIVSDREGGSK